MPGLKSRAKNLKELAENAAFYVQKRPLPFTDKAKAILVAPETVGLMPKLIETYAAADNWQAAPLEEKARAFAESAGVKLGAAAQPLRDEAVAAFERLGVAPVDWWPRPPQSADVAGSAKAYWRSRQRPAELVGGGKVEAVISAALLRRMTQTLAEEARTLRGMPMRPPRPAPRG